MIIATIGEMVYSPILEENRFKMVPSHKRGTYSAVHALGFNLAELLARFGIILECFNFNGDGDLYVCFIIARWHVTLHCSESF